jgi:hypothetical protein
VVINHAHLGEQIEAALGDGSEFGLRIAYSPEPAGALETAGGIAAALPLLGDPFLVVNGDVWCDWDLSRASNASPAGSATSACAHLLLVDNPAHIIPAGDFRLAGDNVLAADGQTDDGTLTYAGIGVFWPEFFAGVPRGGVMKLRPLLDAGIRRGLISGERHAAAGSTSEPANGSPNWTGAWQARMNHQPYSRRRQFVLDRIGDGVAIIPTAPERLRNRDSHYPYRFDSYFWYLSGFPEPEAVIVLVGGKEARSILFCREKNEEREVWDGFRYGPDAAAEAFGFSEAHPIGSSKRSCRS